MKTRFLVTSVSFVALAFYCRPLSAQTDVQSVMSTPPVSLEKKEAIYNAAIEDRTLKIMQALAMTDAAKSNRVHRAIVAHYHALRARDEAIDSELAGSSQSAADWESLRLTMLPDMSKPLHDRFIATISVDLTPEQLETVKDKMTYGKVEFTYSAYCSILPKLTDEEKAEILNLLKQAREVAMDGGSAGEKTMIFQQYKNRINAYLTARGYDVAKATQDWSEKQKLAAKTTGKSAPNSATPPR